MEPSNFSNITFRNVSYEVRPSMFKKLFAFGHDDGPRLVLNKVSGVIETGQLTAIMGRSGCGKTVFIESLAGHRVHGVSGDFRLTPKSGSSHSCRPIQKLNIAYVPQKYSLVQTLTVREVMTFSSKFRNPSNPNHPETVREVIQQVGLNKCADTRLAQCSGGEQKRASIGLELVALPEILIYDDPTSGLDASACYSVIELLKNIAHGSKPITILITVSQPAWDVCQMIDKLIVMSRTNGRVIYEARPDEIMARLAAVGVSSSESCYFNPVDLLMETSSDDKMVIDKLADQQEIEFNNRQGRQKSHPLKSYLRYSGEGNRYFADVFILWHRVSLVILREPMFVLVRLVYHIFLALFIILCYKDLPGFGGCAMSPGVREYHDIEESQDYNGHGFESLNDLLTFQTTLLTALGNSLDGASMFLTLAVAIMVMNISIAFYQLNDTLMVAKQEISNRWYSFTSYYTVQCLADLIPSLTFATLFVLSLYWSIDAPTNKWWRIVCFSLLIMFGTMIAEAAGTFISSLFITNQEAGLQTAQYMMMDFFACTGFLIMYPNMDTEWVIFAYSTFLGYAMRSMMTILYGYERCGDDDDHERRLMRGIDALNGWFSSQSLPVSYNTSVGQLVWPSTRTMVYNDICEQWFGGNIDVEYKIRPLVMNVFSLDEGDLDVILSLLFMHYLIIRLGGYIVLRRVVHHTK